MGSRKILKEKGRSYIRMKGCKKPYNKRFSIIALLETAAVMLALGLPVRAAELADGTGKTMERAGEEPDQPVMEIYSYEDLRKVAENPAGRYRLMEHINMEGLLWEPVDFSGIFDGNGYSLLNLEVNGVSDGIEKTYDGNYKVYDTCFGGLFGTLKGAEVSDLNLVNVKVNVVTDQPCFIGSIAGYSEDSTIRGCRIQGRLELSAHDRMFGVGGIVGYGSGLIEATSADVTLICIDTDASTRDEQFMGGAYSAGHMDLNECSIVIDGYDSDHGYVHNGGLVGMYIFYPAGLKYKGRITNNTVSGMITFYEDNTNRRAYCKEYIGEIMNWDFKNSGNSASFVRNETYDYSVNLRPDMCADGVHAETVTEPGCDTFGYTVISCEGCGYIYTDHYTLYQHNVAEWTTVKEPTVEETGIRTGVCSLCGKVFEEEMERLDPAELEPATSGAAGTLSDAGDRGAGAAESGDRADTADKSEKNAFGQGNPSTEDPSMAFFKNPVATGVMVVLVLLLIVGEIFILKEKKS